MSFRILSLFFIPNYRKLEKMLWIGLYKTYTKSIHSICVYLTIRVLNHRTFFYNFVRIV